MIKYLYILIFFSITIGYAQLPTPIGMDSNTENHNVLITIPEVALLDLESISGTTINIILITPTEAGESVSFNTVNNSIWLNYSSIIGSINDPSRVISVQMTSGEIPSGTYLEVTSATYSGDGDGAFGTPASAISINPTTQNIINNIGSAYTGDGVNNGHNLSYKLELLPDAGSYALLDFEDSSTIEITYTLSDN
jgi:hypothetical protein